MYQIKGKDFPCCASITMGIIGGKWKSVILYYLIGGALRYTQLRKKMKSVTERTLSLQLKALEEDGVISKTVYNSKPPLKVEYALTPFGESLVPLLHNISDWGSYVVHYYEKEGAR